MMTEHLDHFKFSHAMRTQIFKRVFSGLTISAQK